MEWRRYRRFDEVRAGDMIRVSGMTPDLEGLTGIVVTYLGHCPIRVCHRGYDEGIAIVPGWHTTIRPRKKPEHQNIAIIPDSVSLFEFYREDPLESASQEIGLMEPVLA